MKVSIIIPVYNGEQYLSSLFNSILNQTYNNIEIICVNDGSNDNSLQILKNYQNHDKRIIVIDKNNEGPGIARKTGFTKSKGELILFVDCDDKIIDNDAIKKIVTIYEKHHYDILTSNFKIHGKSETIIATSIKNIEIKEGIYNLDKLNNSMIIGNMLGKVFVREKIKDEFFYNSNNFEDIYYFYKYLDECKNFYYFPNCFYEINRYDNNNSLTKTVTPNKIISAADVIIKINNSGIDILSKKYIAFDIYCYQVKNLWLYRKKWQIKDIDKCKDKLKELRVIFKGKALTYSIKYFSFKRYLLYLFSKFYI